MYRYGIIVSSDTRSNGSNQDFCIPAVQDSMKLSSFECVYTTIVPDEILDLQHAIKHCCDQLELDLVWISGGTGFSVRDVTPEALKPLLDKETPGISEAIRAYSMTITKQAMLSRAISGIRKHTLVVTLPGSPKAVKESINFILEPLVHGIEILTGSAHECASKEIK